MNRKIFVKASASLLAATGLPAGFLSAKNSKENAVREITIPPYLKQGDMIGITSPAGYMLREEIIPAATLMQQWGFKLRVGYTIGKRDHTFGGTDEERLQDFQQMLDDPQIKAIMCARGGYGSVRIVDQLNWDKFKANPKWIIGFSDITVLHSHIHQNLAIATLHSKMCNSFPDVWETANPLQKDTIESIRRALIGEKLSYSAPADNSNRSGNAKAVVVGGNLKTIETLAGSASDINTDNKILFVEDTGEYLYSIDRMFWNLKRTGKLAKLAGLIIGGMKIKQDDPGEYFGQSIYDIVTQKVKEYDYPLCFNFPVGHQIDNFPIKCGIVHQLNVTTEDTRLNEV